MLALSTAAEMRPPPPPPQRTPSTRGQEGRTACEMHLAYSKTTGGKAWGCREEQEEQEEKEHEQEAQQHWRPSARHDPTQHSAETGACGGAIKERARHLDLRLPDHGVHGLRVGPRRWNPRCDLDAVLRTARFLHKYRRPGGKLETGGRKT
jgi:hypothetical protein